MNSAEIPYPGPISTVRVAFSRVTQARRASPSAGLTATGNKSCTVPSERATAVPSRTTRSITSRTRRRGGTLSAQGVVRADVLLRQLFDVHIAGGHHANAA